MRNEGLYASVMVMGSRMTLDRQTKRKYKQRLKLPHLHYILSTHYTLSTIKLTSTFTQLQNQKPFRHILNLYCNDMLSSHIFSSYLIKLIYFSITFYNIIYIETHHIVLCIYFSIISLSLHVFLDLDFILLLFLRIQKYPHSHLFV